MQIFTFYFFWYRAARVPPPPPFLFHRELITEMPFTVEVAANTSKLGVVFVEIEKGWPKGVEIKEIKQRSPLKDKAEKGDVLLEVNGEDVRNMTLKEVMGKIVAMARITDANQEPRIFTFARDIGDRLVLKREYQEEAKEEEEPMSPRILSSQKKRVDRTSRLLSAGSRRLSKPVAKVGAKGEDEEARDKNRNKGKLARLRQREWRHDGSGL